MNVDERLNYAKKIITNYFYLDKAFSKLYPFTTENLNGYMSKYDFNDKSVLTVGSSCDQIFNAHMMNAKKIVCFDTNPLSKDYFHLKKAAFKALEYDEFINFFCYFNKSYFEHNIHVFDRTTFKRISSFLEDESYYFWTTLFNNYDGFKIRKKLFVNDEEHIKVISKINSFMSEEGYYKMKELVDSLNPSFIVSDLRNVHNILDEKFDYIMLSNIACFIQSMYKYPLSDFRDNIIKLSDFLNKDGILFLAYLYDMRENTVIKYNWDLIYHLDIVFEFFKNYNFSKEYFIGIKGLIHDDKKFTDMILTLKK